MTFRQDDPLGRVTLCGSGGGSDCIAMRLLPGGKIGLSQSENPDPGRELVFEPHEVSQFVTGFNAGLVPDEIMTAIEADDARQAGASPV